MNPEFETAEKSIALPPDFAERVLREASRRRNRSRRTRSLALGASVVIAMLLAVRLPARLARNHQDRSPVTVLTADWNEGDTINDEDDLDPGSYFLAEAESSPDQGEEPDSALLGQE